MRDRMTGGMNNERRQDMPNRESGGVALRVVDAVLETSRKPHGKGRCCPRRSWNKTQTMKTYILGLLVAAGLVTGCTETRQHMGAAAENDHNVLTGGPMTGTTLSDLPQAVRSTLSSQDPNAEIADIDKTTRNGQVVYEISFTEPGKNPKMYITADGQILSNPNATR